MSDITVVSAFYDISRDDWNGYARSMDKYFEYFKHWARLRNQLVVYVEKSVDKQRILEIRGQYGLVDKTKVVVTANLESLDPELFDSIKAAAENPIQQKFRKYPKNPEVWNGKYNYLMSLKPFFVKDAVERDLIETELAAWMDFGFDHGGDLYPNSEEFDFTWQFKFPRKICLFALEPFDDRPIFDIVGALHTYVQGPMIVAPIELWDIFWLMVRDAMLALNMCGLVDDDQILMLMAYYRCPELFHVEISPNFFQPLKEHGGEHLTMRQNVDRKSKNIARIMKRTAENVIYCCKQFIQLQRNINRI
jgi:protein YibB